jgi:centrosomal protein CEP19
VKPKDRISKDVSDMSMSDFAPKRFALKYDPIPTIGKSSRCLNEFVVAVLEYLVPSTGKLYHHKMKLRQLTGESDPDEMLSYLEKRHPLYFLQRKLSKPQIKNLIKKLIYRMGQTNSKK